MKINGVELEDLDLLDLEVAERFEKGLKKIEDISSKVQGMSATESIKTQCNAVFSIFNDLFGEGTDKKVFGNKVNLLTCLKAFAELVDYSKKPNEEIIKLTQKYSPNRATRRKKK
ncbi:DUF6673 family protein [Haloimpatiens sp. FM7315]|uniref:DUF6673 family protein n=1 Tax=Haloimpatiens sp. FM7315 TaxID=3298609 RepID=UPI0035A3CE36